LAANLVASPLSQPQQSMKIILLGKFIIAFFVTLFETPVAGLHNMSR
jgi:hypothetical protein